MAYDRTVPAFSRAGQTLPARIDHIFLKTALSADVVPLFAKGLFVEEARLA